MKPRQQLLPHRQNKEHLAFVGGHVSLSDHWMLSDTIKTTSTNTERYAEAHDVSETDSFVPVSLIERIFA